MADSELPDSKKRKGSELSSELDTSVNSPEKAISLKPRRPKKKKAKSNSEKVQSRVGNRESEDQTGIRAKDSKEKKMTAEISKQLEVINKKLSSVITKDDGFLRDLIRGMFQQMKDEFLQGVNHRIELLEGRLFEKDQENEKLKREITVLNKKIADEKEEKNKLVDQIQKVNEAAEERINDQEQYGRRNNLRINGIEEEEADETADITTRKIVNKLNGRIQDLNLEISDIDIAHRLGQKRRGSCRPIIVKFLSRLKRDRVIRNRKLFKGTNIYINEDLTRLNQLVLACVRKKMPDEVDKVWSRNGRIYYKNKTGHVHEVKFVDFQQWIDLEWPEPEPSQNNRSNVA